MLSKNTILIPHQVYGSEEVDLNGIEMLLRRQCPEMFSGNYYPATTGVSFPEGTVLVNEDPGGEDLNGDLATVTMASTFSAQTKPTAKKDRHSKIFTAQGPRDRRVRLSIDIARRFFDLQEMLGFDKPSKTLDWLLTKSRAAINELNQTTKQTGSGSSQSEYDEAPSYDTGETFENGRIPKTKDPAFPNTAKESRAKARARARERTRAKLCIKHLNGAACAGLSIPSQNWDNQFEEFHSSAGCNSSNLSSTFNPNAGLSQPILLSCALNSGDLIHDSIVVQRKPKNRSFWGIQQNLDAAAAAAENGDICSFSSQSNHCPIWDQHNKFFSSTSNR